MKRAFPEPAHVDDGAAMRHEGWLRDEPMTPTHRRVALTSVYREKAQ